MGRVDHVSVLIPSSARPAAGNRLDLAIHALAQLPDPVKLEVTTDESGRRSLALLARAYGIEDRVRVGSGAASAGVGRVVFTSGPNMTTALLHSASAHVLAEITTDRSGTKQVHTMAELVDALYEPDDQPAACRKRDDALAGQRVVIVTNRPTHYRVPLFNRLHRRLAAARGSLCVLFTSDLSAKPWMRPEPLGFEYIGLDTRASAAGMPDVPIDLERRLRQVRPTLLLVGSLSPTVGGRVAHFAHRREIPFGVWSGEISPSPTSAGRVRRLQRQWILRRSSYAIAYGYRAGEYLRAVAPTLAVAYGRNTTPFEPPPDRSRRERPVEILAVSQAVPRKRLDLAIDAVRQLDPGACRLTIVGAGPSLDGLRERARGHDNISVLGLVGSDDVLAAYREADVFLFPSGFDPFGLVLVEALGCGLATVVSADPGAVGDLAVTGRNCVVLDSARSEDWAQEVRRLIEQPALRASLGSAAHATINRRWTLDHAADAMAAGLRLGVLSSVDGRRPAGRSWRLPPRSPRRDEDGERAWHGGSRGR